MDDDDRRLAKRIGENIAAHRRDAGLTQAAFAKLLGTGPMVVSKIERGVSLPSLPRLAKIAAALEVRLSWLIDDEPTSWSYGHRIARMLEGYSDDDAREALDVMRALLVRRPRAAGRR